MTHKTLMYQSWRHLLFLHWAVTPEVIQATLPKGLVVDTFERQAYLGLVPFTMRNIRPIGLPAVPYLSNFHECNVRTYVRDINGENPGVWFYSLDAANLIAVKLARALFHLPYFHAEMALSLQKTEIGDVVSYKTTRKGAIGNEAFCQVEWTYDPEIYQAQPETLDHFLCERYQLYTAKKGRLYTGLVHHTPYPLQHVTSLEIAQNLTDAAGFPPFTLPPQTLHYSQGVDVRVSPLVQIV
jgi:uncharacterized protein